MVRQMRLSSFAFFTNASIFAMVAIDAFGACLSLPLDGWRAGGVSPIPGDAANEPLL